MTDIRLVHLNSVPLAFLSGRGPENRPAGAGAGGGAESGPGIIICAFAGGVQVRSLPKKRIDGG